MYAVCMTPWELNSNTTEWQKHSWPNPDNPNLTSSQPTSWGTSHQTVLSLKNQVRTHAGTFLDTDGWMGIFSVELHRSQKRSTLLSLLIWSDKETYCALVYFCPSRSNLVPSAYVHNSSRALARRWGRLPTWNLPPLAALFSTHVAAGFCSSMRLELLFSSLLWPKATGSFQCAKTKGRIWRRY